MGGGKTLNEIERQGKAIADRLYRQAGGIVTDRQRAVEKIVDRYVANIVDNNPKPFYDFARERTGRWSEDQELKKTTGVDVAENTKIPRKIYMKNRNNRK